MPKSALSHPRWLGHFTTAVVFSLFLLLSSYLFTLTTSATSRSEAPGGPGAPSYFDLARKDCLGTARNTTSKVWFTLADGVLSDVYYPTEDNTNVKTLQYIITDGKTFTDLQTRDTTYTVQALNNRALDCRVTTSAKSGKYRIVTDYLTDTQHDSVVMQLHFQALAGNVAGYRLYLRYNPLINGNGGGGRGSNTNVGGDTAVLDTSTDHTLPIAYDTNTKTVAKNRDYGVPVYSALDASQPFLQVSNGFAGTASDGLTQLDASHTLTRRYSQATNGNVVPTAQLDLSRGTTLTLALGFGTTQRAAVNAARGALTTSFNQLQQRYEAGWQAYDNSLVAPKLGLKAALVDEYYLSANVIKASEDKTFAGAEGASLSSPWGQAVPASGQTYSYFGSYREVFARDAYEAWTGFYLDGDLQTARDIVSFLFERQQQADGSMPRNSLLNGKPAPDTGGTQLDETSYPIIMAYQLGMTASTLYQQHIKAAATFIISHGPSYGVERWEDQTGYSPSTISAEIAGLVAAADIALVNHDQASAQLWLGVADDWQRSIERYDVTTNGPLAQHPYYIRISKTGDPNAAINYNLGNGGPTLDQRQVVDAGFLELVRLGLKPANNTAITESLPVVDAVIKAITASGPGWHRYNSDGYGDAATTGQPWPTKDTGTGHPWPVLTEERGEYDLVSGGRSEAISFLDTMHNFSSGVGLIPEQDWELRDLPPSPYGSDPTTASIGFQNGKPIGSAAPLTWAAGSYVRLVRDIDANKLLEQPADTYNRYIAHQQQQTDLIVNGTQPSNNTLIITGRSLPGNTIAISSTNIDHNTQTDVASVKVQADGTFSVTLSISAGTTTVNIVATSPQGATAHNMSLVSIT